MEIVQDGITCVGRYVRQLVQSYHLTNVDINTVFKITPYAQVDTDTSSYFNLEAKGFKEDGIGKTIFGEIPRFRYCYCNEIQDETQKE